MVAVPGSCAAATVSVPASFNVCIAMDGACEADVQGWLEGTVDVSVDEGNVGVGTVRGLHTRVRTGRGDVSIKHVEGNVDVLAGGGGSVSLGKILAQDVKVAASGMLKCTALYSKVLDVTAEDGLLSSVLSSEAGTLRLGGTSSLDSAEGELRIALAAECEGLTVQAIEGLRKLHVYATAASAAQDQSPLPPCIMVHLPENFRAAAEIEAAALHIDDRIEVARGSAAAAPTDGSSSSSSSSAEMSIELVQIGLGGKTDSRGARRREPPPPCDICVRAARSEVTLKQMSWMEQRMKASLEAKAQAGESKRGAF